MPFTVNGIGTSVCKAGADVGWNSYDAVECLVIFFMPVLPYSAVHTFDWNGNRYRRVPVRWRPGLVGGVYLRCWRWAFLLVGLAVLVIGLLNAQTADGIVGAAVGFLLLCLAGLMTALVLVIERRQNEIRRVLGPHVFGSCDPAALESEALEALAGNPKLRYGSDSYGAAVPQLLEAGQYSEAMWAARLSAALEDPAEGEALTDEVLSHPEVAAGLERVRRDPSSWPQVMLTEGERAVRAQQQLRQAGYE